MRCVISGYFSQLLSLNQFNSYGERTCHHRNTRELQHNKKLWLFSITHCLYLETLVSLSRFRDLTISMPISGTSDCASQVSAAACSYCSPALSLDRPVEASHLRVGVSARTAALVLDVISSMVAALASCVRMLTTQTETGCTLGHLATEIVRK